MRIVSAHVCSLGIVYSIDGLRRRALPPVVSSVVLVSVRPLGFVSSVALAVADLPVNASHPSLEIYFWYSYAYGTLSS